MAPHIVLAQEVGRHGFTIVGPFTTRDDAQAWLSSVPVEGLIKPLVPPAKWALNDGSRDDVSA